MYKRQLLSFSINAQRTVSGTITDGDSSEALIGANVMVSGTTIGTITDIDGNFSLEVPNDIQTLEISYAGYAAKSVAIGPGNVLNVGLSAGALLDEIVVTGYGTTRKSDLTGSVGSVKAEDFNGLVFGVVPRAPEFVPGLADLPSNGTPSTTNNGLFPVLTEELPLILKVVSPPG